MRARRHSFASLVAAISASFPLAALTAQSRSMPAEQLVPPLEQMRPAAESELRDVVERFTHDREALYRRYDTDYSAERRARFRTFYAQ